MVTWMSYSGPVRRTLLVPGMRRHVLRLLSMVTWMSYSGPVLRTLPPWDDNTCAYAAFNGHLQLLQWSRAQDPPCPWDEGTCKTTPFSLHLTPPRLRTGESMHPSLLLAFAHIHGEAGTPTVGICSAVVGRNGPFLCAEGVDYFHAKRPHSRCI
jgi:hypothetical protein